MLLGFLKFGEIRGSSTEEKDHKNWVKINSISFEASSALQGELLGPGDEQGDDKFVEADGEGEERAGADGGGEQGEQDAAEDDEAGGAEGGGGAEEGEVELFGAGEDGEHDIGQAEHAMGEHQAGEAVGEADADEGEVHCQGGDDRGHDDGQAE